jgi:hypothetical protein
LTSSPVILGSRRFSALPVQDAKEGFAIGAVTASQEKFFRLHRGNFLGSGDDKELVDARSIAVRNVLKGCLERDRQSQREGRRSGCHNSILLRISPD